MTQSIPNLSRRSSSSGTSQKQPVFNNQRRQTLAALNPDVINPSKSSSFSVPLLNNTINTFIQTTQTMEDEIMLPLRLKDMPVEGNK